MKFCPRPWVHWYLIDAERGDVWPCSWLVNKQVHLGNILEQSVDEMVQSTELKKLQKSILDGSFSYCDSHFCKCIANNELPDLSEDEIREYTSIKYPYEFNIAYDETCNHACPSCRKEYFKGTRDYYDKVKKINEKMLPYYNKAKRISVNGRGDIFACNELMKMLEKLRPENEDFKFIIETNASLFTAQNWNRIKHLSRYHIEVMATVNSLNDSTYRYLNGYANHVEKVIANLQYISSLKQEGIINRFEISMIAQEANFREMPGYVERCLNEFGADAVRIRGIMKFGMDDDEYWFKDIFNPAHPCYKEVLDILHNPVMRDERVWYWEGDYENVRTPKPNYTLRFRENYDALWKIMKIRKNDDVKKIFAKYKDMNFAIYGMSHVGEFLAEMLINNDIIPKVLIDKNKKEKLYNTNIVRVQDISDINKIDEIIITSSYYMEEMLEELREMGYKGKSTMLSDIII